MTLSKPFVVLALTSLFVVSCNKKAESNTEIEKKETAAAVVKKEIPKENLQTASFTVEGMTCAMGCAKTIQEELTELNGVQTATIDFDKKMGTVTFDKTIQTPESLTKVVESTGDGKTYTVSNLK